MDPNDMPAFQTAEHYDAQYGYYTQISPKGIKLYVPRLKG